MEHTPTIAPDVVPIDFRPSEYDFNKLKIDSSVSVIGKRRYGKTIWLEFLLSHIWQYYPGGKCKTKHNQFWQRHFPETRIYENFDHNVVESILAEQKRKLTKFLETGTYDESPYIVVVLDDMISDKNLRYDELLKRFIFAGRHFFIFFAICQQDVKGLGPDIRNNQDIIALTFQTQERSLHSLQDDYAELFDDPNMMRALIKSSTEDHQMLLIDQSGIYSFKLPNSPLEAHYDPEKVFFVSKAPDPKTNPLKPFKIGSDRFWKDSGCDWKRQLKRSKKYPQLEKDKWLTIAKRQYRKEKTIANETQGEDDEGEGENIKFTTNQIALAPPEVQASYQEAIRKKWHLQTSNTTDAFKTIDSLFKFVPGKANGGYLP